MKRSILRKTTAFFSAFVLLATYIVPSMSITALAVGTPDKIDVWDLGAEQLDSNIYNNKLTADIINGFYPGVAAGTASKNLASFSVDGGDFGFNDGTYPTTHRLRTTNTALTRYDAKSLKSADGLTTYSGYIYSNKGSTPGVYVYINCQKGDIIKVDVASNGNNSTIVFESPTGVKSSQVHKLGSATVTEMTFYAGEAGVYKIYSADEKLCLARAYREHTSDVTVSGSVAAPTALTSAYSISFKNKMTGEVIDAPVSAGAYSVTLKEKYSYDLSLKDAQGYIISTALSLSVPADSTGVTNNVGVVAVDLKTLSGNVTGLKPADLAKLSLSFTKPADKIFIPVVTLDAITGAYSVQLENGVDYTVTASNVNDYNCAVSSKNVTADATADIAFTEKPVYDVAITANGLTTEEVAATNFTFTNLNESGYVYNFTGTAAIKLRDGTYSIKTATGIQSVQKLTSNLVVSGAATAKTVNFEKTYTWEFSDPAFTSATTFTAFKGLALSGVAANGGKYALINTTGSVSVPVAGNSKVTVYYCYAAAGSIGTDTPKAFSTTSNSTALIESATYIYNGAAGTVPVTLTGKTYITKIVVTPLVQYKDTVTVGATGCDYTTLNAAMSAIKAMDRYDVATSSTKRVTVMVQPGNYEEMLVIDEPNVTLKNASSTPSIALKDAGVNIADQAVRITSYYGHGYYYYSMGSDCKYSSELLEVNKANGTQSFNNPGSGTTNGSYWNATVVISGKGFEADGIIFENSYNQYVSAKEAADIVVMGTGNKGARPTTVGDTSVQNKSFVERAAALAIMNDSGNTSFTNCRFVGRQDTLYGGSGVTALFDSCNIMGATDYIFGPMTLVCYKCDLTLNTSDDKNDVAYITAPQQTTGRGYLMYACNIVSTTPGVDTASTMISKPGYFGRPWQGTTSEAVFYATKIGATTTYLDAATGTVSTKSEPQSLIADIGWNSTLGGTSDKCYEFGTVELAGVDNTAARATWAHLITTPKIDNGATDITIEAFLGTTWASTLQGAGKLATLTESDYTLVDRFITLANSLKQSNYTDFSAVVNAISAVVRDLAISSQDTVTKAAFNILNAIKALTEVSADYTTLSKAITDADALTVTKYTDESYANVKTALDAAKALSTTLTISQQADVDNASKALKDAVAALVIKTVTIPATENTAITVVDKSAVIPSGATLSVAQVTTGTNYDKAAAIVKAATIDTTAVAGQFVIFDINLKDSSNVAVTQLSGKVTVTIPVPTGIDVTKNPTVFRVETDGTLTKLETSVSDGNIVFTTDHFSTYVVTEVVAASTTTTTTAPVSPIVQTGDTTPITLYAIILGGSACTFMYATRKRKRIRKAL